MSITEEMAGSMAPGIPHAACGLPFLPPLNPAQAEVTRDWVVRGAVPTVSGPPGTGKSPWMTQVVGEFTARGTRVVVMSTGGGKTRAAWTALSAWLDIGKAAHAFQEALTRPSVSSTTLLSASEADNKLPAITSSLVLDDADSLTNYSGRDPVGLLEDLCLLLKEIERPIQDLHQVLEVLLGVSHFEAPGPAAALATSPCGVIRFAAPMVPRAPGRGQPVSLTADHYALAA
ncbi:AAA family ATPase [Streptomyces sp. tea 10]|nr:AAA family ATPase [Streptomyces sp. tea 10]